MKVEDEGMLEVYEHMVEERHSIWAKRQIGEPQPWTTDPVLSNFKFTNMFRVLDPGSQFVFAITTNDVVDAIARLVFYRCTNLPATWYELRAALGRYPTAQDFVHNQEELFSILDRRRNNGESVFSGAYIIMPEPGTKHDKISGALRLVQRFLQEGHVEEFFLASTAQEQYKALNATPGLGKFLSMQILADWGYVQEEEPDLSFVVAGPGAKRGAALLDSSVKPEEVIRQLTHRWEVRSSVGLAGRSLTPMDVQNTLCEFGKYARELVNPRKKTPYKPAHPGDQAKPLVPAWWAT